MTVQEWSRLLQCAMLIIPAVTAFTHIPCTKSRIVRSSYENKCPFGKCYQDGQVCFSRAVRGMDLKVIMNSESGKQSTTGDLARLKSPFLNHEVLINVVTEKTEMSVAKKLLQVINWAYRGKPGVPGWTGRSKIIGRTQKLLAWCRNHATLLS
jgi:hypothetical protein